MVSANSLIELDDKEVSLISLTWDKNELIKNMGAYFNASYGNKNIIRGEILRLIKEYSNHNAKLENYNPFDMLKSYDFFDSGLMFGIDKFDLVIGPPYGVKISKDLRVIYEKCHGKVPDIQIQYWFMILAEKIVSEDGFISYIIPNSIMFNVFAESFRKKLLDNKSIVGLIDCSNFDVFEHAIVRNVIITMSLKKHDKIEYIPSQNINDVNTLLKQKLQLLDIKMLYAFIRNWSLIYLKPKENLNIVQKIVSNNTMELESYYKELISQGLIAYDKYRGQSEEIIKSRKFHSYKKINDDYKKWLYGEDVTPYSVKWNGKEYFNYCDEVANPRKPFFFNSKRILIREITNPKIYAAYTDEEMYNDPSLIIIVENKDNPKHLLFLLGLLNSKLMTFYHFNSSPKASKGIFPKLLIDDIKKLPVVKADDKTIDKVSKLVFDIIELKKQNKDISKLEIEIDKIFYELYNLSDKEIEIIEGE